MKNRYLLVRCAVVIFSGFLFTVFSAVVRRGNAASMVEPKNDIHVWSVGSPFRDVAPQNFVPPDLEQQAEKLGYTIDVQNFRAAGFPAMLHEAVAAHAGPEFITFENFGILTGVDTPNGRYSGVVDTDYEIAASLQMVDEKLAPIQPRGWVAILRSAPNYEAARTLVMQPPQCRISVGNVEESLAGELKEALEASNHAAWAYLGCDKPSLTAQSDEARFGRKCFEPNLSVHVENVRSCGILGNDSLVFVPLAGTFATQMNEPAPRASLQYNYWLNQNSLGQQTVLAILRKQSGGWRLLAITDDPIDTNPSVSSTFANLQRLAKLLTNEGGDSVVPSPAVLTTADGARLRRLSQNSFDNFEWVPSDSRDVIAEVAEFLIGEGTRERTRLFFLIGHENRLSSGLVMGLGGRWRVWSINKSGNVSLTESRSYTNH